ncbi:MAG: branched-chain amino acid ABC transporter substrate-binding protein [Pseudopedobacter sp.]|nr:branched-chain amino acid ABC transporter substrate-binding protein [Deinococcales bacterium]
MNVKVLLSIALLTTFSSAVAQELPIITVGLMAPLSGSLAGLGAEVRNAASLTLVQARLEFRKLGFDLRLKSYDDQASDVEGRKKAQAAIEDPFTLIMVGAINSGVTIPVSDVLAPAHLGMVSPASTNPKVTDRGLKNINRIVARDDDQGPAGANFITDTLGAKSVFVVDDGTTYGKGLSEQVLPLVKTRGLSVKGAVSTVERKNFKSVVDAVIVAKPDVVYFGGENDTGAPFIKQLREAGVNAQFVGADALDAADFKKQAGDAAKGVYFTATVAPPASYSGAKTFSDTFKRRYSSEVTGFGILGYDAMQVALKALKDAIELNDGKRPSRIQVESALRKVRAPGLLTGDIRFNSAGDRIDSTIFILKIGDDLVSRVASVVKAGAEKK